MQETKCGGFIHGSSQKAVGIGWGDEKSPTLTGSNKRAVAIDMRNMTENEINNTLQANAYKDTNSNNTVISHEANSDCGYVVRRITPLECERLQGFPDGWTDIGEWVDSKGKSRKQADAPRYKALGNSIALPSWYYVLDKLSAFCGDDHTMASLFDGIGGFPLIWETINGKGSCVWASEIEEFPIAVTKRHFPDTEAQEP